MAAGGQEQIFDSYSCQLCTNVDTMGMVQCDKCDKWFHYDCVGVSDGVANREWSCKFCIQLQEAIQDLEKCQGSPKIPNAFSYVSSKASTRKSMTASQKAVALDRLEEEQAIKLDILDRKYRILGLTESEKDEVSRDGGKSSMDYTLHWAKKVQNISKRLAKMSFRDNVSISLSDYERENVNKLSSQELRNNVAYKSAESTQRGSEKILRRSAFMDDGQQQQPSHSKTIDGQSQPITEPKFERGEGKKFVRMGNESKTGAVPKIQQRLISEDRRTHNPRKVLQTREPELKFVSGTPKGHHDRRWLIGDNRWHERTPVKRPTSEILDWENLNSQSNRQPNFQLPITQPLMQSYDFDPAPLVQSTSGAQPDAVQLGIRGSGYVARDPTTSLNQTQIASRHVFKDLPDFSGRAEDWPIFLSSLKNSTVSCGYSDGENLGRLQKCLKGDAKDLVRSRLLHADSVPGVVETLHLIFGRPSLIIHQLLDRINKTPSPKADDLGSLIRFAILVQNLCGTIEASGDLEYLQNPILMQSITDKLPTTIQLNWAFYKSSSGSVNLSTLGQWLYRLAQVATDVVNPSSLKFNERRDQDKDDNRPKGWQTSHTNGQSEKQIAADASRSSKSFKCHACGSESVHKLENCKEFKLMTTDDRWILIKKFNVCGSCFGNHHYYKCRTKKKCNKDGCNANHHIMLHNTPKEVVTTVSDIREEASANSHRSMRSTDKFPDIFRIVPVFLSCDGQSIRIFAYLDDGSNLTSLQEEIADKIGATGTKSPLCVLWALGNNQVESNSRRVSIKISGVFDGAEEFTLDHVRTVKKLVLPSQSITKQWLNQYSHLDGIPISTYTNAVPQMIIGLQYSRLMVSLETIEGGLSEPIVCRTRLGWVVQGPNDQNMQSDSAPKYGLNMCECQMVDSALHQMVKEFFSLESFGVKLTDVDMESKELIRARQLMDSTIKKRGDRFESALLWRKDDIQLPNSWNMALRRLECVESKMKKNSVLAERMCAYIADFVKKGYIRKLSTTEKQIVGPRTWYLPIFPVFNPKKPDKLRVVWDGAAKVDGQSLNSNLLVGPDLLVPLPDILMRFRQRRVGITGDIKEMFHQILVRELDQDSQRFLWRDGNSSVNPDTYAMNVMTFGSSCSPSIAQFVKNKNAMDFKDKYPRAFEAITKSHYVDDLIESTHTPGEAIQLINEVQFIHKHAGFELRSFNSNSSEVLKELNDGPLDGAKMLDDNVNFTTERVLGMYWNTELDSFTYCLKFVKCAKFNSQIDKFAPTKREVLSTVMSVFDPLGLLAHFVVWAKILLQEIWRSKIGWDNPLPPVFRNKWIQWLDELPKVERVQIPRLYSMRMSPSPPTSIQLHLFVDAAFEAFAAVAYFRVENESGVDSCLVQAKTRVAPIKPMTVPRLELHGAVLGTRLAGSIIKSHNGMQIDKTIIWCDSRTVLSWINSDLRKYNQFVSFRVSEILDSAYIEWRWIPSSENVADEATKSKEIADVETSTRWYHGPEFLRDPDSNWSFELEQPEYETDEEIRTLYLLAHLDIQVKEFVDFQRFSNWRRLVRTMAYVQRFVYNLRADIDVRRSNLFSSEELLMAESFLYKKIQYDCFQEELVVVRFNETAPMNKQKKFPPTSPIRLCSAYIDDYGVMRMRGRIDAAPISDTAKRPIILSRHHYVTRLVVNFYHQKYKHLHHQTVLNEVQQKFWIPQLRVFLGVIRNNCQKCKNTAAIPRVPEMASLPKARLAVYTRPFTYVGIDYFGPISVVHGRGTAKRWGVLITCFTTRAIHLEIAHSLDTSSCIMAINNFICIRGQPKEFYSDNGTNFHGADNALRKELEEEFSKLNKDQIQEEFTTSEYSWTFNPPAAPHMGGVWERMVQSVKKCLEQSMTARYPTDEVLRNLFAEAENIVNSRPLTYVPLDSPDDEILTPNHFLIGSSSGRKPAGDFGDSDLLRNNWRTAQAMADKFWDAFVLEYLPTIMKRTKWTSNVEPVRVDDVVLIVDDSFRRNTWAKGIIVEVFKDKSKQIRSARVRTSLGTFLTRPVSKLVVLDVRRDLVNQTTRG